MVNFEYPLQYPQTQPRSKTRNRARFGGHSTSYAGDMLVAELERMGAKKCIISSNLQTRSRGDGFYANQRVDDTGVAIYFELKGAQKVMACDCWDRVEHNLWALYLSVSAIRGLERWGGSEFLDGLFTGFKALPAPSDIQKYPRFFDDCFDQEERKRKYRLLSKELHPDVGGNPDEFGEMVRQFKEAQD